MIHCSLHPSIDAKSTGQKWSAERAGGQRAGGRRRTGGITKTRGRGGAAQSWWPSSRRSARGSVLDEEEAEWGINVLHAHAKLAAARPGWSH
jgi:hypothetical protein